MSKPNKPGELVDVKVSAISLVNKAANKKTFQIFKSAGGVESGAGVAEPDEKGFFQVVKDYFTGPMEKGEMADKYNAREKSRKFYVAIDSLQQTLGLNRYGENAELLEPKKIREALDDFRKVSEDILLGNDGDVKKFAEEVQKSGRKIAGPRRSRLKNIYEELGKILSETDSGDGEGTPSEGAQKGANDVSKEEMQELVKGALSEALTPINERMEKLEKASATPEEDAEKKKKKDGESGCAKSEAEVMDDAIKAAIAEAISPLNDRLEKVEKARGVSNAIPEDLKKEQESDLFKGAFFGGGK